MRIGVEVPDVILESGAWTRDVIEAEVRRQVALALYRSKAVSEGKAAQIAGMNRFEFSHFLGERRVERNYGLEELRKDLEWVKGYQGPSAAAAPLKDGTL